MTNMDDHSRASEITIWISSAPSWACFDPDLPREAKGVPPPSKR
jgi:hypothetical protein